MVIPQPLHKHHMNQKNITDNIRKLADSVDIFDSCERIGKKLGLHIDQIGAIDAHIRAILRGQAEAKNFTNDIKKYLEIDDGLARQIAEEVNTEIFQTIRADLRSQTSQEAPPMLDNSSLERAGGFTIEPADGPGFPVSQANISKPASPMTTDAALNATMTEADRVGMIKGIEEPAMNRGPLKPKTSEEAHYEPLVDQLLNGPVAMPQQKIEHVNEAAPVPSKAPPPINLPTNDPYREPIE